ncbi:PQQ-binding-like beta-propeller repeat protein [Treponema sp. HNW]|uniref:outer membrane protein assembly factor BamB family protein n=1 Tax=Treponema sp. HNW TaxID=3116654 RepID=UPI003D150537
MKVSEMKKSRILFLLLLPLIPLGAAEKNEAPPSGNFAQNTITEPLWQSVLGGNALAAPKRTSYGFAAINEGKILSACTGNGTVIWRRRLAEEASALYTVSRKNFIYLVSSDGTRLSLYNPDGTLLWSRILPEKAVSPPLCGRDGRVFTAGSGSVSCYGSGGTKRWTLLLPEKSDFPLTEMNDGSLLYIPREKKGSASTGKRISPYGELLEDIVFTAELSALFSCENGVLTGFKTGTAGCVAVVKSRTSTLYSIPPVSSNRAGELIINGTENFCILYADSVLCAYQTQSGRLLWKTRNPELKAGEEFDAFFDGHAYHFVRTKAEYTYAVSYAAANGDIIRETKIKTAANAHFPLITPSLHLILCGDKWIVSGYDLKAKQTEAKLQEPAKLQESAEERRGGNYDFKPEKIKLYGYKAFTAHKTDLSLPPPSGASGRYERTADIASHLKQGDFGAKEYGYKKRIKSDLNAYQDEYAVLQKRLSVNAAEKINTLYLIERFETADFNYAVSLFLKNEDEPVLLAAALHCAGKLGYDPDGSMLEAIEQVYNVKKTSLSDSVLIELAEAVYSLCRYMGRPAFIKRGKAILSDMLSLRTRDGMLQVRVREIMLRFIELEH